MTSTQSPVLKSPGHMTCALKLDTQTGWHKSLIKMLKSIDGVTYSIDAQQGIAYISGKIDPGKLLKMLAKSGKHAELCWVDSGNKSVQNPNQFGAYGNPNQLGAYGSPNLYYGSGYVDPYYHYAPAASAPRYEPSAPVATAPFYKPEPKYFPQPPPPHGSFNVGDSQWCSIM